MTSRKVASQIDPSQQASQRFEEAHECLCGYGGQLADHLRESLQCVQNFREEPALQIKARNDEVYISKVTLILRGCPAPGCPGGNHQEIPNKCVLWWNNFGLDLMGWRGSSEGTNSEVLNRKISQFRRNYKHRMSNKGCGSQTLSQSSQLRDETNCQFDSGTIERNCCEFCVHQGQLINHLLQTKPCLEAYLQQYMPTRSAMYVGKMRLALFDLTILLSLCRNPSCEIRISNKGISKQAAEALSKHLRGPCFNFYQMEGACVFGWPEEFDMQGVITKLIQRRCVLRKFAKNNSEEERLGRYQTEFDEMLTRECCNCLVRGPFLGQRKHDLECTGYCPTTNRPQWICLACKNQEEGHMEMVDQARVRMEALSKEKPEDNAALIAVEVEQPDKNCKRVVFLPLDLVGDLKRVEDETELPHNTTVVVPNHPESLDAIEDNVFEEANQDKEPLMNLTEFAARRPFFVPPSMVLSVFWRMKQANIRLERLAMLRSLGCTSKGEIESRDPNRADVVPRNAHYAATKKFCLANTCSWSAAAQEQRACESHARSAVHGVVKTKIAVTLLNIEATGGNKPTLSVAPVVLTAINGKLKLLTSNVIAPSYAKFDLDLRFEAKEWRIELVGFLYSQQFEEINTKIAQECATHEEIVVAITSCRTVMPTVSLNFSQLAADYAMTEERAQVIETHSWTRFNCQ